MVNPHVFLHVRGDVLRHFWMQRQRDDCYKRNMPNEFEGRLLSIGNLCIVHAN